METQPSNGEVIMGETEEFLEKLEKVEKERKESQETLGSSHIEPVVDIVVHEASEAGEIVDDDVSGEQIERDFGDNKAVEEEIEEEADAYFAAEGYADAKVNEAIDEEEQSIFAGITDSKKSYNES